MKKTGVKYLDLEIAVATALNTALNRRRES